MSLHALLGNLFVFGFLVALGIFTLGLVRKKPELKRGGTYVFLATYALFLLMYAHGLSIKEPELTALQSEYAAGIPKLEKHHKMSKFMFTGTMLMAAACIAVNLKFKKEDFPTWFGPNFLFLYLTLLFFLMRVLITAYQIRPPNLR